MDATGLNRRPHRHVSVTHCFIEQNFLGDRETSEYAVSFVISDFCIAWLRKRAATRFWFGGETGLNRRRFQRYT